MPMIVLDQAHWTQLEQVQMMVDAQVVYVDDMKQYGVEDYWEPAKTKGDCEDIALAKRQRLEALGWPADDLRIAVVIDGTGQLHAVLTVDAVSTKGAPATYVMDSRFVHVEPWKRLNEYGYTWVERAKPGRTEWSRLDGGAPAAQTVIALLQATVVTGSPGAASPVGVESQGQRGEVLAEGVADAVGGVAHVDAAVDIAEGGLHAALAPAQPDLTVAHQGAGGVGGPAGLAQGS
jgi:predicted transglutaminase-like cysteine proteinase